MTAAIVAIITLAAIHTATLYWLATRTTRSFNELTTEVRRLSRKGEGT